MTEQPKLKQQKLNFVASSRWYVSE